MFVGNNKIHNTPVQHRSDQIVPYAAMKWLEGALPSCTCTVIPGGTHAFVYDKGNMEEVFASVQKGLQEARVSLASKQPSNPANSVPFSSTKENESRVLFCFPMIDVVWWGVVYVLLCKPYTDLGHIHVERTCVLEPPPPCLGVTS